LFFSETLVVLDNQFSSSITAIMLEIYQKTLSKNIKFVGIGLHSGKTSTVKILPADVDTGIIFKRVDLKKNNFIKANFSHVTSTKLCTTLENIYGVKVSTVEHLLAAIYISGIDNAIIEINNEEVPIMDGSAKEFLDFIKNKGLKNQHKKRKYLKVLDKVELKDEHRQISIEPNDSSLEVNFQLDYENKVIGKQKNTVDFQRDDLSDVVVSRTFCLYNDIEKIKKLGLAKGGSLDNAIVVDDDKILNEGGLRNTKEFVNHKILDLSGDFLLSGYRILGKVFCYHGGHELSNLLLHRIFEKKSLFKIVELDNVYISKEIKFKHPHKLAVNA
jgi:UDP-3-O-[3-hydroxymyristoyl] N-acetylglucosamine deacetylase